MIQLPFTKVNLSQYIGDKCKDFSTHKALLDTGSQVTLCSAKFAEESGLSQSRISPITLAGAIGDERDTITKAIFANIRFGTEEKNFELINKRFLVKRGLHYEILLGMDTLRGLKLNLTNTPEISVNNIEKTKKWHFDSVPVPKNAVFGH